MSKLMLIDAAHPEETRVAIATDGRVDDFDFETTGSEQLRGNIYLAKVTRVEPSLQAAFVEYGGNRHGFLAFSEIHPDYYQLPQEDREALLREAAEEAAAAAEEEEDEDGGVELDEDADDVIEASDIDDSASDEEDDDDDADDDDTDIADASADEDDDEEDGDDDDAEEDDADAPKSKARSNKGAKAESAGRRPRRKSKRPHISRRYKIQEVIRRRQVMLVQVVKEERGNKGAALTTYLSLAGRYSVLMPNTPRGGGISRKIANGADRKRLKSIVAELNVPEGQGLIVRTAGAKRTKTDIKRDYDYLSKLWEQIVEKTLSSEAPMLINAEGGLVHRAMRDMFDKDIEEVLVHGEAAYREAKDLAKMLMPSQAKKVQQWKESDPLFVAEGVDEELDSIFSPTVQLKSGGYLVINQTEALVAIDVNSGKSTRERNVEQTALRTNLEAAEEACRQMRLRDLAGLVVIDFIDMDENKNNRAVEKKMKECLRVDRARVQHGRISQFGLMEISRQRRRQGVLQATSSPCGTCNGTGRVRSIPSATLQLIRAIEARAAAGNLKSITVTAPTEVALFLLNNKREDLTAIETVAGFAISIQSSEELFAGEFKIDAEKDPNKKAKPKRKKRPPAKTSKAKADEAEADDLDTDEDEEETGGRRRRRRGGRGRGRGLSDADTGETTDTDEEDTSEAKGDDSADDDDDDVPKKRRRRGRRGGRRRRRGSENAEGENTDGPKSDPVPRDGGAYLDGLSVTHEEMLGEKADPVEAKAEAAEEKAKPETKAETAEEKPKRTRRPRKPKAKAEAKGEDAPAAAEASPEVTPEPVAEKAEEATAEAAEKPKRRTRKKPQPKAETPEPASALAPAEASTEEADPKPKKRGWWSRG